jgi:beta-galactosidase
VTLRRPDRRSLDSGWEFRLDDRSPEPVQLPHSWNALDVVAIGQPDNYHRGVGTYVREPFDPALADGRRLWMEIEAAFQKAFIDLNGVRVGEHLGGYSGFTVELTPAAHGLRGPLSLVATVDNRPDPDLLPDELADFTLYGGLTRHAWIYETGPLRIEAVWPLTDVAVGPAGATARLAVKVRLDHPPDPPASVRVVLRSPEGELAKECATIATEQFVTVDVGELLEATPRLWSPDDPCLYQLAVAVEGSDEVQLEIGFRHFEFPPGGRFSLNGVPLQLRGTHRHEDWAGMGSAVPDHLTRHELEMVRAAGFNFIRLGHYPQAPAVLDACDQLGLLVWEELPWCRGGVNGEGFKTRARVMLEEMIEQHHHHPAVIFWGLGNEIGEIYTGNQNTGSTQEGVVEFLAELNDLAHGLDPGRLTALRRSEPGSKVVDVYSPSNWSGWFGGRYEGYEQALAELRGRGYPRLFHAEWGGDSHVGRHSTGPHFPGGEGVQVSRDGDWSESYILDLIEWHLQILLRSPIAGFAQWTSKDFDTPWRPENPLPGVNQKGFLDRAGRPKDAYYLFQSYLATEPMCYIESPTWPHRVGAEGESQRLRVYSNCSEVELFVNEVSVGSRLRDPAAFPAAGLVWHVPLRQGSNLIRAVGDIGVEHQVVVTYHVGPVGEAARLSFITEPSTTPSGLPSTLITVQVEDSAGVPAVADARWIEFEATDGGDLWVDRGTFDGSRRLQAANGRACVHALGAGVVVARAEGLPPIRVSVRPTL